MTVNERVNSFAGNAAYKVADGFSKSIPMPFEANGLEVGDVITLPKDYSGKIFTQIINGNEAQFVVAEVIKVDGTKSSMNFYPSSLTKSIFPAEMSEDGNVKLKLPVLNPLGQVVSDYLSFRGKGDDNQSDVAKAMNSFKGKSIKITNRTEIPVQKIGNDAGKIVRYNELRNTFQYTYDWK